MSTQTPSGIEDQLINEDVAQQLKPNKAQAQKQLKAHIYTKFQFIAYEVPTDRPLPAGAVCQSKLFDDVGLEQVEKDLNARLSDDARARLARILTVVEMAATANGFIDPLATTLKVFMAPEFYFRPETGDVSRSYKESDKNIIVATLARLATHYEDFDHWMFVFGTIAWQRSGQDAFKDADKLDEDAKDFNNPDKMFFANTALVVSSTFRSTPTPGIATFEKKHYSKADDVAAGDQFAVVGTNVDNDSSSNDASVESTKSVKSTPSMRNLLKKSKTLQSARNIITVAAKRGMRGALVTINGNMRIGVEVCADHAAGLLWNCARDTKKEGPFGLQLLTACGMEVQSGNVTVEKGGFVLRVDGNPKVPSEWTPPYFYSEIQRRIGTTQNNKPKMSVAQDGKGGTKDDWKENNEIATAYVLGFSRKLDVSGCGLLTRAKYQPDKNGNLELAKDTEQINFSNAYPQRLVIYKPLDLPRISGLPNEKK